MPGEWWRSTVEKIRRTDPLRARQLERSYRRYDRERERMERRWTADVFGAARIEMDDCALRAPAVRGMTESQCSSLRICYRCGDGLPPSKRRWCSRSCEDGWWENHSWTVASARAAARDEHRCVACGRGRGEMIDPGRCRTDGETWPCAMVAGASPNAYTWPHYREGERYVQIEINHRVPLNGRGYHNGCVHHLTLLEALCHDCHVAETTRQRRARGRVTSVPQAATA